MSGTQATQWDGHLAEVMWRSEVKGNRYSKLLDMRSVYTLEGSPDYKYSTGPVVGNLSDWSSPPDFTDVGSDETSSAGGT
jgi:hypothetical protein